MRVGDLRGLPCVVVGVRLGDGSRRGLEGKRLEPAVCEIAQAHDPRALGQARELPGVVVAVGDLALAGHRHGLPGPVGSIGVEDPWRGSVGLDLGGQPVEVVVPPGDGAGARGRVGDLRQPAADVVGVVNRRAVVVVGWRARPVEPCERGLVEGVVPELGHLILPVGPGEHVPVVVVGEAFAPPQRIDPGLDDVLVVVGELGRALRGTPLIADEAQVAVGVVLEG